MEALTGRVEGAEETLEAATQILRANQIRLRIFLARLNQADGWEGRKR
jgi:hypothetical protein